MIFAKLDVQYHRHPRFVRAGLEACGYWCAVLAFLRDNDSENGLIEDADVGLPLHVGDETGRRLCDRLVQVGLFERANTGYVLLRYAEKNETREKIEARRAADRERQEAWRAEHRKRHGVTNVPPKHPSRNLSRNVSHVAPGSGSGSGSDSGSDLPLLGGGGSEGGTVEVQDAAPAGPGRGTTLESDQQGLPGIKPGRPRSPRAASIPAADVADVFDAWLALKRRHDPEVAEPPTMAERADLLRKCLCKHSVATLRDAAEGIWLSEWHVRNGRTDLSHALADAASIAQFATLKAKARAAASAPPPASGGGTVRYIMHMGKRIAVSD